MTSIDFVVYYPAEMEIKKILLISLLWQDYVENTASCIQNYTLELRGFFDPQKIIIFARQIDLKLKKLEEFFLERNTDNY